MAYHGAVVRVWIWDPDGEQGYLPDEYVVLLVEPDGGRTFGIRHDGSPATVMQVATESDGIVMSRNRRCTNLWREADVGERGKH